MCIDSSGDVTYKSAFECSGAAWIYDNVSTRVNDSMCSCDCNDCLYPTMASGIINDLGPREEEIYNLSEGSCCIGMGAKGWPGSVNVAVDLPWANLTTGETISSWQEAYDDGVNSLKSTDLVGWLCGWNSVAHQFSYNPSVSEDGCWKGTFKYCLDKDTCPALFDESYVWPVDTNCWTPTTLGEGIDFCAGDFIKTDKGMNLNIPLDCEGCQLGAVSRFDYDGNNPALALDGQQGNTETRRNLRGIPKRFETCFSSDYDLTPTGACCHINDAGVQDCEQTTENGCESKDPSGDWYINTLCDSINCEETGSCCNYTPLVSMDMIFLIDVSNYMNPASDTVYHQCLVENPPTTGQNAMHNIVPVLSEFVDKMYDSVGSDPNISIYAYRGPVNFECPTDSDGSPDGWGEANEGPGCYYKQVTDFSNVSFVTKIALNGLKTEDHVSHEIEQALPAVINKFDSSGALKKVLVIVGTGNDNNWNVPSDPPADLMQLIADRGIETYSIALPGSQASEFDCVDSAAYRIMHNATYTQYVDWGTTKNRLYYARGAEDLHLIGDELIKQLHSGNCYNTYRNSNVCSDPNSYQHGGDCNVDPCSAECQNETSWPCDY